MADAPSILREHGEAVATYLRSLKARYADAPPRLIESIEYSLLAGGKRLRPALVLESARACGGRPAENGPLAAAAAI